MREYNPEKYHFPLSLYLCDGTNIHYLYRYSLNFTALIISPTALYLGAIRAPQNKCDFDARFIQPKPGGFSRIYTPLGLSLHFPSALSDSLLFFRFVLQHHNTRLVSSSSSSSVATAQLPPPLSLSLLCRTDPATRIFYADRAVMLSFGTCVSTSFLADFLQLDWLLYSFSLCISLGCVFTRYTFETLLLTSCRRLRNSEGAAISALICLRAR